MKDWIKKHWVAIVAVVVLGIALLIWFLTRKQSGWAAQKILDLQGGVEEKAQRIEQKKTEQINKLDQEWAAKRKAIVAKEQADIAKATTEAERLSQAALKRRLLEDLDGPL